MIAINWFEVLLPSSIVQVPVQQFGSRDEALEVRKSITHRTILISSDEQEILYHITPEELEGTELEDVNLASNKHEHFSVRSVGKNAIERGFADRLEEEGFQVTFGHVGGVGYRYLAKALPVLPGIYRSMEGIEFRCFYGFDGNEDKPLRWGLVLKWLTSQRFTISLEDEKLRQLAKGQRVVLVDVQDDDQVEVQDEGSEIRSGILESASHGKAVIIDRDENRHIVPLHKFTLPCSRANLLSYVRTAQSSHLANEVASQIQCDALTLTPEGRMNTSPT